MDPRSAQRTFCRICEAACGLTAEVDAYGQVRRLKPDREHPVSGGFVCQKGTRFADVAKHPARLLRPMRRIDGRLHPTSWDTANRIAGERLRTIIDRHGPHAVGMYWGNPLAFSALGTLGVVLFNKALGSRNVFAAGSQDCNNKFAGAHIVHGSPFIHPVPDLEHAELAVMFGTNPAVSQGSFVHLGGGSRVFDALVARGGDVVWVDPRRTESAARWGQHLAVRPGTDVWLLLALLARCAQAPGARLDTGGAQTRGLDRLLALAAAQDLRHVARITGLSAEAITTLADRISRARGVAFHQSVGVNQGPAGTLSYVVLQALAYVTGNLDARGGSLFHPWGPGFDRFLRWCGVGYSQHRSRIGNFPSVLDTLPGGILADEILTEGPERLRALIVIAGDPLASIPGAAQLRKALPELELLVSIDLFENQTGAFADLILPTPTWLERWDVAVPGLVLQSSPWTQFTPRTAPPPPHVRGELPILAELSRRIGRPLLGHDTLAAALSLPLDGALSAVADALQHAGFDGVPTPVPEPGSYVGRRVRTDDGRLQFWSETLAAEADRLNELVEQFGGAPLEASNAAASFQLMCRRRRLGHNSWLHGGHRDGRTEAEAWLHPEDLAALGVTAGDAIAVARGAQRLTLPARPDEGVPRRTVVVPHGLPEVNVNALIAAGESRIEPTSGMLWMTGVPVSVHAAQDRGIVDRSP